MLSQRDDRRFLLESSQRKGCTAVVADMNAHQNIPYGISGIERPDFSFFSVMGWPAHLTFVVLDGHVSWFFQTWSCWWGRPR